MRDSCADLMTNNRYQVSCAIHRLVAGRVINLQSLVCGVTRLSNQQKPPKHYFSPGAAVNDVSRLVYAMIVGFVNCGRVARASASSPSPISTDQTNQLI